MSKKNINDNIIEQIENQEMTEAMDSRFLTYAFMTLEDRALPDARDGLKPSQRRVLVAMNDLKLSPKSSTEKSAKICGDTSGNYHPHGDQIVYPTMYRMAQGWVLREPLVVGQGNFGNLDGDPPAAARYTEAKLSHFGSAMLEDLSPDIVPFVPTYNEKREEPTVLPGLFPNLLVNGAQGIAVGWATNLLPHNYIEVVNAIELYISNPNITESDIIKVMPGPDFPTGGKLLGQDGVIEYYRTGHGSVKVDGKYEIVKKGKENTKIIVTEFPYQSSPESFAIEIKDLVEDGKLQGISNLKDLSSLKEGIKVVIEVSRSSNEQLVLNNLLKNTSLRKSYGVNATVLIDGKVVPGTGIIKLIETFVNHRRQVLTSKYTADLAKTMARIHILDGLIEASKRIDDVIKIVRNSDNDEEASVKLIESKIVSTQIQANAILSITMRQLTKMESNKFIAEKTEKNSHVDWLKNILSNKKEIDKIIVKEQKELSAKIGTPRRTEVSASFNDIDNEELIKDEQLIVCLTGDGYVKSIPPDQFRMQNRGGKGVNSNDGREDNIFELFESSSKEYILFFTNKGLMYKKKAYEIPKSTRTAKGMHVSNLLSLSDGEYVTNMMNIKDISSEKNYLVIATKMGLIKKSKISDYDTSLKTAGLTAIKLNDNDQVAFVLMTNGSQDIFIVTKNGNSVRYSEDLVSVQGRSTLGVRALILSTDDEIVQILAIDKKTEPDILVVTEGGFGKRSSASEYRSSGGRNVKGYSVLNKASIVKNGKVVGAACVTNDSILVATLKGKVIRMDSAELRSTGRATAGVRIVKLDENDSVSRIATIKHSDEDLFNE